MMRIFIYGLSLILCLAACGGDNPTTPNLDGGVGGTMQVQSSSVASTSSGGGTSTSSTSTGMSTEYEEALPNLAECDVVREVTITQPDNGVLSVGVFLPPIGTKITDFVYQPTLNTSHIPPCLDLSHEIVYFLSKESIPEEVPSEIHQVSSIPFIEGDLVSIKLNPPLLTTQDFPYVVVGVRFASTVFGSVCVQACKPGQHLDRNFRSLQAIPPYNWKLLSEVPDSTSGLHVDLLYKIAGVTNP